MRVVVAGAGLGGLALATGLARHGHEVVVLEADESATSRPQGYRIHLDRRGLDALRAVLPEPAADLVEATCGRFAAPRRLEIRTGRLRHLKTIATGPGEVDGRLVSTAADRGTLRGVLAAVATDLGVEIRWNTAISGYEDAGGRVVTVHADAPVTDVAPTADLLVACDGARSRVAAQRLPNLRIDDDGAGSIVGRSPLGAVSPRLMESLDHGYVVLRGLRTSVGLGLLRFANPPDRAAAQAGRSLAAVDDYVMWNVGVTARDGLRDASPELLHDNAFHRLRGWHRDVRTLVEAGAPERTMLAPALRARRPAQWAASRVTLLGDAVHVMPPDRGSGANLALADAARLAAALRGMTGDDEAGLRRAVGACERAMVEQAFAVTEAGPATGRR